MHDIHHIRKLVRWGIPLYLGLVAGAALMTRHALVLMVQDIVSRAPVVRITPGMHLMPCVVAFGSLAIVVMVMRAIPCRPSLIKKFEFAANLAVAASAIALLLVPVVSIAQRSYMPSIGYTPCHALQGQPTRWFTDWVRDPAWCMKGKSPDWVNEQARHPPP
ncbi:hypothetical protein [Paracidovorax avenae]|uniref:hypothetical protein n=1 Tax=Paracidovorax avenae TaxID=80867 RepID=UPI000D1FE08C|nr:hypothetical protein [Paracidovorax avenae]AVT12347.1 hypothetical protein C8235_05215 [Paracidovorax avenae]